MAQIQEIQTEADLEALLAASRERPVVLFKHSASCGISAWKRRVLAELEADGDLPLYLLVVQHARPLSSLVSERLGVRHESPQVLVVRNGEAVHHASHVRISAEAIRAAAREAQTAS